MPRSDEIVVDVGQLDQVEFLARHGQDMREAGCKLAEAASHVIREYDGLHRLSLAVAEWYTTVGDEGGRGEQGPSSVEDRTDATVAFASQIDQLAKVIMNEIPGEPSQNEGAVDTAIRLLRAAYVEKT